VIEPMMEAVSVEEIEQSKHDEKLRRTMT